MSETAIRSIVPVTRPKFSVRQEVVHRKGGQYVIEELPVEGCYLEASSEPFYVYRSLVDGTRWCRGQREMEDGRFAASATSKAETTIRRERAKLDELAMLTRRLAHSLRKSSPGNDLSDAALDYLLKHDLAGSPLRD